MSWKFNPPPGWPEQPQGWVPPPGWTPDPGWPPPPAGWEFWVPAVSAAPAPAPASAPPPAAPPPAPPSAAPHVSGGGQPFGGAPSAPFAGTPGSAFPSGQSAPFASATPGSGPAVYSSATPGTGFPPGQSAPFASPAGAAPPYGAVPRQRPPWFGQWWGILGLIALLLLGAAVGYGATRLALESSDEDSALAPVTTMHHPSDDGYRGALR